MENNSEKEPVYKWVSVKDELPDIDGLYLITQKSPSGTGRHELYFKTEDKKWYWQPNPYSVCADGFITHWLKEIKPPQPVEDSEQQEEFNQDFVDAIKDTIKKEMLKAQPVEGVEEKTGDLVLADKSMLIKKVMFYREQTDKLRKYLFDNNIGLPNQGLWDAILEHLQSLNNKSVNNEGVTIEGQLKLRREKYPIGNNESVEEAAERVYDLIAQLSFGGFLSGRITVKEATLKINNLLEWYASQLKRIEEK